MSNYSKFKKSKKLKITIIILIFAWFSFWLFSLFTKNIFPIHSYLENVFIGVTFILLGAGIIYNIHFKKCKCELEKDLTKEEINYQEENSK